MIIIFAEKMQLILLFRYKVDAIILITYIVVVLSVKRLYPYFINVLSQRILFHLTFDGYIYYSSIHPNVRNRIRAALNSLF